MKLKYDKTPYFSITKQELARFGEFVWYKTTITGTSLWQRIKGHIYYWFKN